MCRRIIAGAAGGEDAMRAHIKAQEAVASLPLPEASIALMDAAGVDIVCVVPHRHAIHMNVEPRGTSLGWVIDACDKYPDRLIPGPVFDPSVRGVENAIWEMEYFAKEKGCKYFKIYPPGEKWDTDDERYWPFYAKAQELGLVMGVHTGHGYIYGANTHAAMPRHLENVCREFYDLRVLAFHFGWPWHHELNVLAGAYPGLYVGMSFLDSTVITRPRFFAKLIGEATLLASVDKVIWSHEGLAHAEAIKGFADFQMPEDMQKGYGYPALTDDDKAKIFGLTMAKLLGIEPRKRVGTTKLAGI